MNNSNGIFFRLFSDSEICYVENQSDIDKQTTSLVSVVQEFNKDSKTLGFIKKLKQSSLWTEYFCDANQTYSIKSHSDFLGWGECSPCYSCTWEPDF